MAKSSLFW